MDLLSTHIAVIGLGYDGLPLAAEFGKHYAVTGFDLNPARVVELQAGKDRTLEVSPEELRASTRLRFTTQVEELADCSAYIVTVPTPIDERKQPDLPPLIKTSASVGLVLKKGDIVVHESTESPGVTEEARVPVLDNESRMDFNEDSFAGCRQKPLSPSTVENWVASLKKASSGPPAENSCGLDRGSARVRAVDVKKGPENAPIRLHADCVPAMVRRPLLDEGSSHLMGSNVADTQLELVNYKGLSLGKRRQCQPRQTNAQIFAKRLDLRL